VRKRIFIAVVGLAIVGGLYVLLRPRDTIEYHKRMFLSAGDESVPTRLWSQFRGEGSATERRRKKHETALVRLGYFERREFVLTKIAGEDPVHVIGRAAATNIAGIFSITKNPRGDVVIVTGVREDMPSWEKLINELRSADTNK
jgi:hypothetical protein